MSKNPFWQTLSLEEMSEKQWESLCDGCGRCCLNKLENEDTGQILWTNVACSLLNDETCQCGDYKNRSTLVPDCIQLTPETVRSLSWLPATCAYRLVRENKDLYWWHPLVSGDPDSVHMAGISVRGLTVSEEGMDVEDYDNHLVRWPAEDPFDKSDADSEETK